MPEQKRTVTAREVRKNLKAILEKKQATIVGHEAWGTIQEVRAVIIPIKLNRQERKGSRAAIATARRQAAQTFKQLAALIKNLAHHR